MFVENKDGNEFVVDSTRAVYMFHASIPRQKINLAPTPATAEHLQDQIQQLKVARGILPSSSASPAVTIQRIPVGTTNQKIRAQFFINPADKNFKPVSIFTQSNNRTVQLQALGNVSPVIFSGVRSTIPSSFIASQVGASGTPDTSTTGGGIQNGSDNNQLNLL